MFSFEDSSFYLQTTHLKMYHSCRKYYITISLKTLRTTQVLFEL